MEGSPEFSMAWNLFHDSPVADHFLAHLVVVYNLLSEKSDELG